MDRGLKDREEFELLLFELSAKFVNIPANKVDMEIEKGLELIVNYLGFNRGSLSEFSDDRRSLQVTHSVSRGDLKPISGMTITEEIPWFAGQMQLGKTLVLNKVPDDFPIDAKVDRQYCERHGVKTVLGYPLRVGGVILGAISFGSFDFERPLCDDLVKKLGLVAEIFGNALTRKVAQQEIDELLRFERLVSEISANYINLPTSEIDNGIEKGLERIGRFLGADRCTLLQFSDEGHGFHRTHTWTDKGIKKLSLFTKYERFPWLSAQWRSGKEIQFTSIDSLPPEAEKDYLSFLDIKTKSLVSVPLSVGGNIVGAFAAVTVHAYRSWSEKLLQRMRILGEIFAGTLARKQADLKLQTAFTEIERLKDQLNKENIYLKEEIKLRHQYEDIIGHSSAIKQVLSRVEQVAPTETTVLITGETGTGKELIAHAIHNYSVRKDRAMVTVNCSALPSTLVESELFGREKGAYTGALTKQVGRFDIAHGSTIFLDEIGELPLELQAKLLRVLQEGKFERLGSSETIQVNTRVIAATNKDLEKAVQEGRFRKDLFYRLNVFPIKAPPLRDRPGDIPLLVWAFLKEFAEKMGKRIDTIPRKSMEAMQRYHWPGNIRQLRNIVEHAMIISTGKTLILDIPGAPSSMETNTNSLDAVEREHIQSVLEKTYWRIKGRNGAAELLGLKPSTLYTKMKKLGITRPPQ